jgi:hypothetical protein
MESVERVGIDDGGRRKLAREDSVFRVALARFAIGIVVGGRVVIY